MRTHIREFFKKRVERLMITYGYEDETHTQYSFSLETELRLLQILALYLEIIEEEE